MEILLLQLSLFFAVMARTKQTAMLVEGLESVSKPEIESFDFGASPVTKKDLETYEKRKWFVAGEARPYGSETVPQPRDDDEVVVFREFFLCWLEASCYSLCIGGHAEV